MELRSTRRIVTGHDKDGKAVALYDAPLQAIQRSAGGNGMTLCWVTSEFPVDMASAADRAQTKVGVPPPANGTIFRIVDCAPVPTGGYGAVDHHRILLNMGIDPATKVTRGTRIPTAPAPSITPSCSTARSTCCSTTPKCT